MPRYKLTLEYDGTPFAGWQKVTERLSVQEALEAAIHKFCQEDVQVYGAGRTDAGVHASGQVAHIDLSKDWDSYQVMCGINYHLLDTASATVATSGGEHTYRAVTVTHAEEVDEAFNARFSATRRHYLYRILNRRAPSSLDAMRCWHVVEELDERLMQQAANHLLGHHDFSSFRDSQCQAKSPEKTLDCCEITRQGEEIHIRLHARSFLHHQVRIITGTLKEIGCGKWPPEKMQDILHAKDRKVAGPTAPAHGLMLTQVDY